LFFIAVDVTATTATTATAATTSITATAITTEAENLYLNRITPNREQIR
jgi:hypothetical protein